MTFRLEPWIEKIKSPVVICFPSGKSERYISGDSAVNKVFDKHYIVDKLTSVDGEVMLKLREAKTAATALTGEEQHGFF